MKLLNCKKYIYTSNIIIRQDSGIVWKGNEFNFLKIKRHSIFHIVRFGKVQDVLLYVSVTVPKERGFVVGFIGENHFKY